jgi:imidazoleglycerol phosphate dehydratase HisB/histidinol-phosphate/aromatic aminotransferase/cobyric acid decarboxylase-like protein
MAEVYGVDETCVLPVRGALHAFEVLCRRVRLDGAGAVIAPASAEFAQIARISGVTQGEGGAGAGLVYRASPGADGGASLSENDVRSDLDRFPDALVCIDEGFIEFTERESLAALAARTERLIVVRDLSWAYGLAGAPCGAIIGRPETIARVAEVLEPYPIPTPVARLALAALEPHKCAANARRIEEIREERGRMCAALQSSALVAGAWAGEAPFIYVSPRDRDAVARALRSVSVSALPGVKGLCIPVRKSGENDLVLSALGVNATARSPRRAEALRETSETKILVRVDLDAAGPVAIESGVGFFDHMLTQIAVHGGFAMQLSCAGDLHIDAHHTIEDCALALGQALAQALGARRGIARFGFVLPMDEAEAKVSVDLGGRPYLVFEGAFSAPLIGAYPTEMTEHVFRSLAQSMAAAIHVSVTGENDHHKTEACYKAFGRALRQAIGIEGEAMPSTKGSLV